MLNFIKRLIGIKVINTPSTTPPTTPPGRTQGASNRGQKVEQVAFEHTIALINLRLDNSNWLMGVVLLALTICFLTLFFGYWQFASTSYNDYSKNVKELNDQRYLILENNIKDLQAKIATQSGK